MSAGTCRAHAEAILGELRTVKGKMRADEARSELTGEWKHAAMVIDRFCLWMFTTFIVVLTLAILFSAPHLFVLYIYIYRLNYDRCLLSNCSIGIRGLGRFPEASKETSEDCLSGTCTNRQTMTSRSWSFPSKFEHFGIFRFRVIFRTYKQTDR